MPNAAWRAVGLLFLTTACGIPSVQADDREVSRAAQESTLVPKDADDATKPHHSRRKLDLTVRDLSVLVAEGYVKLEEDDQTITVTGHQEAALPQTDSESPEPWAGIAAPVWALLNPTQAWRIFLPVPQGESDEVGE